MTLADQVKQSLLPAKDCSTGSNTNPIKASGIDRTM